MVSILSLWLPILLSTAAVFVVSSIMHMVLKYHNTDFKKLPSEDQVMNDLRKAGIPPGDYMFPFSADAKERESQEFKDKMKRGPCGVMTVFSSTDMNMGSSLTLWFGYLILVSIFAAYIAGRALAPGADYLEVFRFSGGTAFAAYSLALMQNSIWYKRNWGATLKSMFDGLVYALVTAGFFGWLWPAA